MCRDHMEVWPVGCFMHCNFCLYLSTHSMAILVRTKVKCWATCTLFLHMVTAHFLMHVSQWTLMNTPIFDHNDTVYFFLIFRIFHAKIIRNSYTGSCLGILLNIPRSTPSASCLSGSGGHLHHHLYWMLYNINRHWQCTHFTKCHKKVNYY